MWLRWRRPVWAPRTAQARAAAEELTLQGPARCPAPGALHVCFPEERRAEWTVCFRVPANPEIAWCHPTSISAQQLTAVPVGASMCLVHPSTHVRAERYQTRDFCRQLKCFV